MPAYSTTALPGEHGGRLDVVPADVRRLRALRLPPGLAEVCCTSLVIQGRLIGLLFLLHEQRGAFGEAVKEPLVAVAGMVATSLHNTPEDLPLVQADARMLKVALQQLLDNAITYGGGTPVRVVARAHRAGVALAVRDYGQGIPAADLPHLFGRLRRGAGSNNTAPRGMGLGLVIARELIERQGGKISVQSQPGEGSLFSIYLPRANDAAHALAA
jgi:signal transduction histidine kinase